MSVQLIAWALEQKTGSITRKAVLVALANASNHHTGKCCPSVKRICREIEAGPTAVKNALAQLAEQGLISRERRRRQDGALGTYEYTFPHVKPASDLETPDGQPGTRGVPSPGTRGVPLEPEVVLEPEEDLAAAPSGRPRNELWDALTAVFGDATTISAQSRRGRVIKSLRSARASPDEVISRARRWPLHFDDATLTETALEKHWDTLARPPLRRTR